MLRISLALALAVGFGGSLTAAEPETNKEKLDATLRKLEKDIAAVRDLEFKNPVAAKVVARPKDAAPRTQGYYSTKDKTLYLYDDISGAYELGVLIHEMVHALQDQHFGLANLHAQAFGSDAEAALAALVEGDATFTMIELLKKDQPKVAAMLDGPLEKAKDVRTAFLYAQGARYVKALKERGGWAAVNAAYRRSPATTAHVLHPEGVKTIDLGPGTARGELGVIEFLAGIEETRPLAVKTAAGWKADRFRKDGQTSSWVVAFAAPDGAAAFAEAVAKFHEARGKDLKLAPTRPGAKVWRDPKGAVVAVHILGDRVLVVEAPDDAAHRAALDRLAGPLPLVVHSTRDKKVLGFGEFTDRLLDADTICVGETHDSDLHHRVQLQIIKAVHARDERVGVGMEMFQRPFQKEIDRYLSGDSTEEAFLKATEYQQRWGFDWWLYRPVVEYCRRNGLPVAALNVPRELTARLGAVGHAGLTADEKGKLGTIDFEVKEHRDYWLDRLAKMHGKEKVTAEQKERSYQVMTAWDEYMAASAAEFQKERQVRRLVVLAGSGHIDRGFGIPDRAAKRSGGKVVTVRIEVGSDPDKAPEPVADYVVIVRQP